MCGGVVECWLYVDVGYVFFFVVLVMVVWIMFVYLICCECVEVLLFLVLLIGIMLYVVVLMSVFSSFGVVVIRWVLVMCVVFLMLCGVLMGS